MAAPLRIIAADLLPGDVLVKAGRTARSITVTEAGSNAPYSPTVRVAGFTGDNPTPRLMFRALAANLPVGVIR